MAPVGRPLRLCPRNWQVAAISRAGMDRKRRQCMAYPSRPALSRPHAHLLRGSARLSRARRCHAGRMRGAWDGMVSDDHGRGLPFGVRPAAPGRGLRSLAGAGQFALGAGAAVVVTALTLALFFQTYREAIRPRMEAAGNPYLQVAEAVKEVTRPGDLVLATGTGWLAQGEVYIPYFSGRPLLAMQVVLKRQNGSKEAAFDYLRHYMERCWTRGSRVYILDEALESREAYGVLLERYGLSHEEARQFFQAYAPSPVLQAGAHSIWQLSPPAVMDSTVAAAPQTAKARVLGMRQRLSEEEVARSPNGSEEAAPRGEKEQSEADRPAAVNRSRDREASGRAEAMAGADERDDARGSSGVTGPRGTTGRASRG
jgi:hypothetical protein